MDDYFKHPKRFPKNISGPFYTLGEVGNDGTWCGQCLSCEIPENEAPSLLAPLTDSNSDTYFLRQPETAEEIEQACSAIEVCCVDALRYGGRDEKILKRLRRTGCTDYSLRVGNGSVLAVDTPDQLPIKGVIPKKWWQLWK